MLSRVSFWLISLVLPLWQLQVVADSTNVQVNLGGSGNDSLIPIPVFTTTFVEPSLNTELSFAGGNSHIPPDQNFARFTNFSDAYEDSWVGFAMDNFAAHLEVEFNISASTNGSALHSFEHIFFTLPSQLVEVGSDGFSLTLSFGMFGNVSASQASSFSTGFNLTLPEPAAMVLDKTQLDKLSKKNSNVQGFDKFNVSPIFRSGYNNLNFELQLGFRTILAVEYIGVALASLNLDLPAYFIMVDQVNNSLADCTTAPPGTPAEQIFPQLTRIRESVVSDATFDLKGLKPIELFAVPIANLTEMCKAYYPNIGALGPVPTDVSALTATSAPGISPTTQSCVATELKSLSAGAGAGITLATIIVLGAAITGLWHWRICCCRRRGRVGPSSASFTSHNNNSRSLGSIIAGVFLAMAAVLSMSKRRAERGEKEMTRTSPAWKMGFEESSGSMAGAEHIGFSPVPQQQQQQQQHPYYSSPHHSHGQQILEQQKLYDGRRTVTMTREIDHRPRNLGSPSPSYVSNLGDHVEYGRPVWQQTGSYLHQADHLRSPPGQQLGEY